MESTHDRRPLRILVVDDDRDTVETMALWLRLAGCEVETARNGPQALFLARGYRPDVIFLDVAMPGMDGWAVARQLRSDPATRQTRIVNVTGYSREVDRQRSLAAGCDELWTKPVSPEQLAGLLESLQRVQAGEQG
jgi:two-component system CheB/CheR fusion protein